jgi:hypothetical protein
MNSLYFRLLVCMKFARHVEYSSASWQFKQWKNKVFWAGQSPFLLYGAFSFKVFASEIKCSIHKCDEILSMQSMNGCHSFWSGIVFGMFINVHLMQRLTSYGTFSLIFFMS